MLGHQVASARAGSPRRGVGGLPKTDLSTEYRPRDHPRHRPRHCPAAPPLRSPSPVLSWRITTSGWPCDNRATTRIRSASTSWRSMQARTAG
jgi:hypothetical protein